MNNWTKKETTLKKIINFISELIKGDFTGNIKINFHRGNICNDEVEKTFKEKIE